MPYRSHQQQAATPKAETGLVADMVRQFADPYACMRELVQNAIDAGATRVDVRLALSPEGEAALSIEDDGEGMNQAIIEGPLLTLFNSSKDEETGKIGKYGVGFVSIFALDPERVVVETWRDDEAWSLTLLPDHSYELARAPERDRSGTRVTMLRAMTRDAFDEHVALAREALARWCRHAALPIGFTHDHPGKSAAAEPERVDESFGLEGDIVVTKVIDGARYVAAPALPDDDGRIVSFAGFYNHGLTLFETDVAPTRGLLGARVKVMSAGLQHTLSRDNVRHDAAYHEAIAELEQLVRGPLRAALAAALAEEAARVAQGGDATRYARLLVAALGGALELDPLEIVLPLANPIGGRAVWALTDFYTAEAMVCHEPSALTHALMFEHEAVIRLPSEAATVALGQRLSLKRADDVYRLVADLTKKEATFYDGKLSKLALRYLQEVGAKVGDVRLGRAYGKTTPPLAERVESGRRGRHLQKRGKKRPLWDRFGAPTAVCVCDVRHPVVAGARQLASDDAPMAAVMLARALLVAAGRMSKRRGDRLLELVVADRVAARQKKRTKRRKRKAR